MDFFLRCIRVLDTINDWIGKVIAWLVVPMVGALVYEVFARYFFHAPTEWAYDVTYMLYGGLFMLGAAYTLLKGGHIRTDMFYRLFSPRWQGIVDASLYLLFFFPGLILFFIAGCEYASRSWMIQETASMSPWRPIIYPFKTVIPVSIFMLLIQGISELMKSIYAAVKGEWP
ncbi:MAG: TRAP transporter small permease subunit [Desulfobacterales bacterium]|nr:MAG: TRAP transporter small permease subunit [Desulfobacterales bacterium]